VPHITGTESFTPARHHLDDAEMYALRNVGDEH
jgi:hypothetical protein